MRFVIVSLVLVLLAATASASTANEAMESPKSVLVLLDGSADNDLELRFITGFKSALRELQPASGAPYRLHIEFLDLSRAMDVAATATVRRSILAQRYAGVRFDIIVTNGPGALNFALGCRNELWPGTPIVFAGVPRSEDVLARLPTNVSGAAIEWDIKGTLDLAYAVLPDARRVYLIVGQSASDQALVEPIREEVRSHYPTITLVEMVGLPWETLASRVRELPKDSFILATGQRSDWSGQRFDAIQALKIGSRIANRPVVTLTETTFGYGTIGGSLLDFALVGADAAQRILAYTASGRHPGGPVPTIKPTARKVDARMLKRWSISESRVPPGVAIYFQESDLWRDHRAIVIASISIILALSMLTLALLIERHRRRRAEVESTRRLAEMAKMHRAASMGQLSASIAHELKQPLGAVHNYAEGAKLLLGSEMFPRERVLEALEAIRASSQRAADVLGRVRRMFQPADRPHESVDMLEVLHETVGLLAEEAARRKVALVTEVDDSLPVVMGDPVQLQQVFVNLVLNAMDACEGRAEPLVKITLRQARDGIEFAVSDNGAGIAEHELPRVFAPFYTTKVDGMGMGLAVVRAVIEAHGGQVDAMPAETGGARLRVWVPSLVPEDE